MQVPIVGVGALGVTEDKILGGFSNLGATMAELGVYEGLPADVRGSVIRGTGDSHSAGVSGRGPDSARMAKQRCGRGTLSVVGRGNHCFLWGCQTLDPPGLRAWPED